jgi:xylan 1,4-beta-xylosidase
MVWHYHDDDVPAPDAAVELALAGLSGGHYRATHYRIDAEHANAFTAWQRLGSPAKPTPEQLATLSAAGKLSVTGRTDLPVTDRQAKLSLKLPRQAVELIVLETA